MDLKVGIKPFQGQFKSRFGSKGETHYVELLILVVIFFNILLLIEVPFMLLGNNPLPLLVRFGRCKEPRFKWYKLPIFLWIGKIATHVSVTFILK